MTASVPLYLDPPLSSSIIQSTGNVFTALYTVSIARGHYKVQRDSLQSSLSHFEFVSFQHDITQCKHDVNSVLDNDNLSEGTNVQKFKNGCYIDQIVVIKGRLKRKDNS